MYTYLFSCKQPHAAHARVSTGHYRELASKTIGPDINTGGILRPISLLTLPLLTLFESNFPGKSLGNPCGLGNSTPVNEDHARVKPLEIHNVSRGIGRTTQHTKQASSGGTVPGRRK